MKTVSAAQANRQFSALLRDVARGVQVVVTSRGRPAARIVPANGGHGGRRAGRHALLPRLEELPVRGKRNWKRKELYWRGLTVVDPFIDQPHPHTKHRPLNCSVGG